MMQLLTDIIQQVLDCFSNPEDVSELTIIQGMSPGEWWVHTDSDVYMHVHWLRDYGLITSVHEYNDWLCERIPEPDIPEWLVKSSMDDVVKPLLEAYRHPKDKRLDRDVLGRVVRKAWMEWAEQQPNPKSSWLVPYEELDEPDKEADRLIGERVAQYVKIVLKVQLRELEQLTDLA